MSLKTKKSALASVKTRTRKVHGETYSFYDAYLGMNELTNKPVRIYANSKDELEKKLDEFYDTRKEAGDLAAVLTADQIMDAKRAFKELEKLSSDITLYELAREEVRRSRNGCIEKTLKEAYEEYAETKSIQSWDEQHKTQTTVGRFVGKFKPEMKTNNVTPRDVAEYLRTQFDGMKPRTYNSNLAYISTFFAWCMKPARRYCLENPAESIERRQVAWKKPQYMKPDDVERMMRLLEATNIKTKHPEWLAIAVTQLFVGTRRVEAFRAKDGEAATILLEDETFRVDKGKGYTKNKAPRTAHMEPNAIAWMKSFDYFDGLKKIGKWSTETMYDFLRANKIPVFTNFMRHTFITMHVAKFHTPEVTQAMVGTSGAMRAAHYDGLAPQKEGEAYFNIYPSQST